MRHKVILQKISVRKEIYDRLRKDREHFQKTIGGGRWSLSDTIEEYLKIISLYKKPSKKVK